MRTLAVSNHSHRGCNFVPQLAVGIYQLNAQRYFPQGVRRATQAGIVGPHHGRDPVQHAFLQLVAIDEMLADLLHAAADGEIIVSRGDDQVRPVMPPSSFTL